MVDSCAKKYTKSISWRVNTLGNSREMFYSRKPMIACSKIILLICKVSIWVVRNLWIFEWTLKAHFCSFKNKLQLSASTCIFSNIFHTTKKAAWGALLTVCPTIQINWLLAKRFAQNNRKKIQNFIFVLEKYTFSRTSHPSWFFTKGWRKSDSVNTARWLVNRPAK